MPISLWCHHPCQLTWVLNLLLMIWGALSGAVYTVIETFAHRPRPSADLVHVLRHTAGYSFPSGHVVFFTWILAYLLLILVRSHVPRVSYLVLWGTAAVFVLLVAVGRVYTAEHWPSDVLAGLLLGVGWTALGISIRRLSDPVLNG
jgi:membrane-associated phospholipid phosphatase